MNDPKKKHCIVKKVWDKFTPYIQFGGWMFLVCAVILSSSALMDKARAFDSRLTNVERAALTNSNMNKNLDDKLDLVIELLRDRK